MFQFARQSAKAVFVAASAAGIAALSAGAAGADDLGALNATDSLPQSTPVTAGLPAGLGGGATSLVGKLTEADLSQIQPAPSTVNMVTPGGDMSHLGPQTQGQLNGLQGTLNGVRNTVGLRHGAVPQAAPNGVVPNQGLPTGGLPTGAVTDLLGGATSAVPGGITETLPLNSGVVPQAAPDDVASTLPADAGGAASTLPANDVLPGQGLPTGGLPTGAVTDLLGGATSVVPIPSGGTGSLPLSNELPAPAPADIVEGPSADASANTDGSVDGPSAEVSGDADGSAATSAEADGADAAALANEQLSKPAAQVPEAKASLDGVDADAVESAVPGAEQATDAVGAPSVNETAGQVDTGSVVGDVTDAAASGAGATGVLDVVDGIGTPAL
ncbi:hypothetical protein GCM10027570_16830 [Streptomonospora sediminis]